jgi:hypothetical protein
MLVTLSTSGCNPVGLLFSDNRVAIFFCKSEKDIIMIIKEARISNAGSLGGIEAQRGVSVVVCCLEAANTATSIRF